MTVEEPMTYLATCSFRDFRAEMGKPVRISLGRPKFRCDANGATSLWDLTPRGSYFHAEPDEFARRYIAQLDRVGVARLLKQFRELDDGRPLILLCFERNVRSGADCHRRRFAEWWLEQTGEIIPEIGDADHGLPNPDDDLRWFNEVYRRRFPNDTALLADLDQQLARFNEEHPEELDHDPAD
jgi:Protein of unknown function, DUF488